MSNYNFVQASLAEFLNVWSAGGDASLNLTTTGGHVTMALNVSLGHPGSAFSPPPSSVRRQRHRGPADKEKSRQRAAAHEAAAAGHQETLERAASPPLTDPPQSSSTQSIHPTLFSPTTTTAPVMNSTFVSVTARPATVATVFKCDRCTAVFKNEGDLKTHMHIADRGRVGGGKHGDDRPLRNQCSI